MGIARITVAWACEICKDEEITDSPDRHPSTWISSKNVSNSHWKTGHAAAERSKNNLFSFTWEKLNKSLVCDTCFESIQKCIKEALEEAEKSVLENILLLKGLDLTSPASEAEIKTLFDEYIEQLKNWDKRSQNRMITFPNDLMVQVESNIPVLSEAAGTFRQNLTNHIGSLAVEGKTFDISNCSEAFRNALRITVLEQKAITVLEQKAVDGYGKQKRTT